MEKRFLVRYVFLFLLLGVFTGPHRMLSASAEVTGADQVSPAVVAATQDDEGSRQFETYRQVSASLPLAFGPASGTLAHDPDVFTYVDAGLSVSDFVAHATCAAPVAAPNALWDCGFAFRDLNSPSHFRVVVFSDLTWYLSTGSADEPLQSGNGTSVAQPGNQLSLDLVVTGPTGYLGVNGACVAVLDLSALSGPGSIAVGTSFFMSTYVEGAATSFQDFTVTSLDGVQVPVAAQTNEAGGLAAPVQDGSGESTGNSTEVDGSLTDAAVYDQLWNQAITGEPLSGPVSGVMRHDPVEITVADAEISVSDFAARVTCLTPEIDPLIVWDCGYEFRGVGNVDHYRLLVTSNGWWELAIGPAPPIQSGQLAASMPLSVITVDIVVQGTTGYFQVNDEFVSMLDLSALTGPGTVAAGTAFKVETYIPGGITLYEDFTVWPLDSSTSPDAGAPVVVTGNSYTNPTFGYSLTWDNTWSVTADAVQLGEELSITNGGVTALLSSFNGLNGEATGCFQNLIDRYLRDPAYSGVGFLLDEHGAPLVSSGEFVAGALLTMTVAHDGTPGTELWDYVLCARVPDSLVVVYLEQLISPGSFVSQQQAMETLQMGLWVNDIKSVTPPGLPSLSGVVSQPRDEDLSNFAQLGLVVAGRTPEAQTSGIGLSLDQTTGDYWAAGVEFIDLWVRVDLASPELATVGDWQFQIAYRAAGSGSDSILVTSDGSWDAGQASGILSRAPDSIDLVALGSTGYLAFDGVLVAMLDLSTWMQPGDVIVSAGPLGTTAPGARFIIESIAIWNMEAGDQPAGASTVTYVEADAAAFPGMLPVSGSSAALVFGPVGGSMVHEPGLVSFQKTNIAVRDFAAHVSCQTPTAGLWDCGFAFGDLSSELHYRIGITSDGTWFLGQGSGQAMFSGTYTPLNLFPGDPVVIDLIVRNDVAYLGVNGVYVATVEVPSLTDQGTVALASAFYADTTMDGGIVFDSFRVWTLDEPTDPVFEGSVEGQNSYVSPTYGYSLTWDASWSVVSDTSAGGVDHLALTNGSVFVDLYSVDMNVEATVCNEDLFQYYASDPRYSNVAYLLDDVGNPLIVPGTDLATVWLSFDFTDDQGLTTSYLDFAVCARLPDGSTMVQLELRATPDATIENVAAMQALVMALDLGQTPMDILDLKSG